MGYYTFPGVYLNFVVRILKVKIGISGDVNRDHIKVLVTATLLITTRV